MASTVSVREYREGDRPALTDLLTQLHEYFVELDQAKERRAFASSEEADKYLHQAIEDTKKMAGAVFVAEQDEKIVGFIQGVIVGHDNDVMHKLSHNFDKQGWIGLLFTSPDSRGQGVGRSLLDNMKKFMQGQGCTSMRLKVASNNELGLGLYAKYGFTPREVEMAIQL